MADDRKPDTEQPVPAKQDPVNDAPHKQEGPAPSAPAEPAEPNDRKA